MEQTPLDEVKSFWKNIVYQDGKINEEQVMKELSDYYFVMHEVPKVYCEITGGLLSKIMYPAEIILSEFNDKFWDKETIQDDIDILIKEAKTLDDLKNSLKDYFQL